MAARIIESVVVEPATLRMALGSQALESALTTLRQRIASFEPQGELAASTYLARLPTGLISARRGRAARRHRLLSRRR